MEVSSRVDMTGRQKQAAGKVACGVDDGDKDKEKWKKHHESEVGVK